MASVPSEPVGDNASAVYNVFPDILPTVKVREDTGREHNHILTDMAVTLRVTSIDTKNRKSDMAVKPPRSGDPNYYRVIDDVETSVRTPTNSR